MGYDARAGGSPEPEQVFAALDDPACRDIVSALDGPMTAKQVSEAADVPLSTAYKKLDRLESAAMLNELTEIDTGGHHRSRYVVAFERLVVELDDGRSFLVEVEDGGRGPDSQLVELWSQVRRET
ncbi:helix-turn-helix domain-containing protein [Halorubrum sp. JWXQ-INN 858]|uniref:winged helix-turn-helix domain-containing protein n=1 Tax=Halorubrum sp. JWXQ-INN 858 TaxID=2690782 RepID=UPI00135A959E|nr:helix-turn-helix domain-containing protein [Halorubrum sp. JWXQ-INN 858]MWV64290.1 helix-turn-helix domain-containing protein [Halorubrum sp. JWXQ-INN 858]